MRPAEAAPHLGVILLFWLGILAICALAAAPVILALSVAWSAR